MVKRQRQRLRGSRKREKDSLIEMLDSPVHADPAKIKQLNLKTLEEELWTT